MNFPWLASLRSIPYIEWTILYCLFIMVLFCLGLIFLRRESRWLDDETSVLDQVSVNCQTLLAETDRSQLVLEAAILGDYLERKTFVGDRVRAVKQTMERGGDFHPHTHSAVAAIELQNHLTYVRYMANSLILFGLLGTLFGLSLAVFNLSQGVSGHTIADAKTAVAAVVALQNLIAKTLGSMYTAFAASFFAVLCTIWLHWALTRMRSRQDDFLAQLETFTARDLVPLFKPATLDNSLGTLAGSFAESASFMREFSRHTSEQVLQAENRVQDLMVLVGQLKDSRDELNQGIDSLVESQKNMSLMQQQVSQTVVNLGDSLQNLTILGPQTQELLQQLAGLTTRQDEMLQGMGNIFKAQEDMQENVQRFMERSEDLYDRRLTALLSTTGEQLEQVHQRQAELLPVLQERLDTLVGEQRKATATMTQNHQEDRVFRKSGQNVLQEQFLPALQTMHTLMQTMTGLTQVLQASGDRWTENLQMQSDLIRNMDEFWRQQRRPYTRQDEWPGGFETRPQTPKRTAGWQPPPEKAPEEAHTSTAWEPQQTAPADQPPRPPGFFRRWFPWFFRPEPVPSPEKPDFNSEDTRFSIYYPEQVAAQASSAIWAFVHTAAITEEVKAEAARFLQIAPEDLGGGSAGPGVPLTRGVTLQVTIDIPGLTFDKAQADLPFEHDLQYVSFGFQAPDAEGVPYSGWLSFWLQGLLLASLEVSFTVAAAEAQFSQAPPAVRTAAPYRKIFACYSRQDEDVVARVGAYLRLTGDSVLRDCVNILPGEDWRDKIQTLIQQADIFQLFWSQNAAQSPEVRQEVLQAMEIRAARPDPHFIRPLYWQEPYPPVPDELEQLRTIQFARIPFL